MLHCLVITVIKVSSKIPKVRNETDKFLLGTENGLLGSYDPAGREAGSVDAGDQLTEERPECAKPVHCGPGLVCPWQHLLSRNGQRLDTRAGALASEQQLVHQEKGRPLLHKVRTLSMICLPLLI